MRGDDNPRFDSARRDEFALPPRKGITMIIIVMIIMKRKKGKKRNYLTKGNFGG